MRVIKISTTQDTYDCDLCGMDWADGGKIYIDGELIDEVEPVAHCFGGTSANKYELIILALAHMGVDVIVDGDKSHISCIEVDERRDKVLKSLEIKCG